MYKNVTFRIVYNAKEKWKLYICGVGEEFNKYRTTAEKCGKFICTYKGSVQIYNY